jgi:molybdate transport system substrate-binding protein
MRATRCTLTTLAIASVIGIAACSSTTSKPSRSDSLRGTITVLGASSLTNAFKDFEAAHPGARVQLSFGSSTELASQVEQGVPADVFASADDKNMDRVVNAKHNATQPVHFARNTLTIAVPRGNPQRITSLTDLANNDLNVLLCDAAVPCGRFADEVLARANVTLTPKSREASARVTIAKVELGEADAAIVYASDVLASSKVDQVKIPAAVNVVTSLPIVVLKASQRPALAQAWIDYVIAHQNDLVSKYGFLAL